MLRVAFDNNDMILKQSHLVCSGAITTFGLFLDINIAPVRISWDTSHTSRNTQPLRLHYLHEVIGIAG